MNNTENKNMEGKYEFGVTNKFPFTTLLKNDIKRSWTNTWYPIPIDEHKKAFRIDTTVEKNKNLLSNISYNMQYLEFLEKEFTELEVSSVIYVMLVKTYVVTSASIIEGLLTELTKRKGWKLDPDIRKELNIRKGTFEEKIKIIEEQCRKNDIDTSIISEINDVRELRNRIHLQKGKSKNNETETTIRSIADHDYSTFNEEIKIKTGNLLYKILSSDEISTDPKWFEFLKTNLNTTK